MATLTLNSKAPDFTLYDTEKQQVKLSDLKGKNVLLLFFPFAFTSVCTEELCAVRDNLSVYNEANVEVIGISVDSLFTLAKFKEDQQLNFTLLSDFNKEVSTAYGVLYEMFPAFGLLGVSRRAAFLLDKEGNIKYEEICPSPGDQPNFEEIKTILSGLN